MSPHQLTLLRAADLLEADARDVKASHTRSDGTWDLRDPLDANAKADHDERMAIASKLRLMAGM